MEFVSINFLFALAVLVVSVVVHEVSHGYMAYILGDPTAKLAGRLTLNPIKHVDPFGSILVPLFLTLLPGGIVFGWAKPVPYNPYNLKAGKYGPAYVAFAGPASNLLLALIFGLIIRLGVAGSILGPSAGSILSTIVLVNIMLALFNLLPIPPLDGSTIVFSFLSPNSKVRNFFYRYQIVFILGIILFAGVILDRVLATIYHIITGI